MRPRTREIWFGAIEEEIRKRSDLGGGGERERSVDASEYGDNAEKDRPRKRGAPTSSERDDDVTALP